MKKQGLIVAGMLVFSIGIVHGGEINCAMTVGGAHGCGANDRYILPPAEYDRRFPGVVIENAMPDQTDMERVCAPNPKAAIAMGCSSRYQRGDELRCYVWIAPDSYLNKYKVTVDAIRRHEIAHCLGWPQSHPKSGFGLNTNARQ